MKENDIKKIIEKTFKKKIRNIQNLKIGSFNNWDSIAHLNLILNIEKKYRLRFTIDEITKMNSVKKIIRTLKKYEV